VEYHEARSLEDQKRQSIQRKGVRTPQPKSTAGNYFPIKSLTTTQAQNVWSSICKHGMMKGISEDKQATAWKNVEEVLGKMPGDDKGQSL
jgi:hypothetical protein